MNRVRESPFCGTGFLYGKELGWHPNAEVSGMSREDYMYNNDVREYFLKLPAPVQNAVIDTGMEISTLGELQMWAEHYMKSHPNSRG